MLNGDHITIFSHCGYQKHC